MLRNTKSKFPSLENTKKWNASIFLAELHKKPKLRDSHRVVLELSYLNQTK